MSTQKNKESTNYDLDDADNDIWILLCKLTPHHKGTSNAHRIIKETIKELEEIRKSISIEQKKKHPHPKKNKGIKRKKMEQNKKENINQLKQQEPTKECTGKCKK